MEKELASVFKYFAFFDYVPNFDDVYTFFPKKIKKKQLQNELKQIKYTPVEYSIKRKISKKKLENWRYRVYIKLLSSFPQIKLVGLSGSISMLNANLEHDIDLFIITEKNRLFTARFLATIISFIMGLKRNIGQNEAPNKVCLNLFFDENNLKVPKFKQTKFVGHEVLQMKPIINKNQTYEKFLNANEWVFRLFPNSRSLISNFKNSKLNKNFKLKIKNLSDWLESQLKKFQLRLINKHRTTEIITSTQLWFHPDDFEKKINTD